MALGDVVDELHDEHSLAHTGTAEETNFTTFGIGFEQVDNLDTGVEHLTTGLEVFKLWSFAMDRISLNTFVEGAETIDAIAGHIEHTSLNLVANGHRDGRAERNSLKATLQPVGIVHSHTTHGIFTDMLLDLKDNLASVGVYHLEGIVYFGQHLIGFMPGLVEGHVNHRTDNLRDSPGSCYTVFVHIVMYK